MPRIISLIFLIVFAGFAISDPAPAHCARGGCGLPALSQTGFGLLRFKEFSASPYNLVFNADGSMLAICATEGDIAIADTRSAAEIISQQKQEP